jgi:UDP-glucose 4-epimerase
MKERVVITGGCGFIGSYTIQEFLGHGYDVTVIDSLIQGKEEAAAGAKLIVGDIRNKEILLQTIQEGDTIVHLAALTSVPGSLENPDEYFSVNVLGTHNVLEAAREKKARGIVFASSAAVYGNQEGIMHEALTPLPESNYGLHKYMGELLLASYTHNYGIPSAALRFFNVYGKNQPDTGSYAPVMARFIQAKKENRSLSVTGDGTQSRDFVHVRDVARAIRKGTEILEKQPYVVANIASGKEERIIDIAKKVGGEITFIPARKEIYRSVGAINKAKEVLNWEPEIAFEDGLQTLL